MRNTFERILILQHDPLKTQFRCLCLHALRDFQQVLPSTAAKKGVCGDCNRFLLSVSYWGLLVVTEDLIWTREHWVREDIGNWRNKPSCSHVALSPLCSPSEVMDSGGVGEWLSVWTCIWIARTDIKPEAAALVCTPTTHWELTGQLSWCVHWWTSNPILVRGKMGSHTYRHTQIFA